MAFLGDFGKVLRIAAPVIYYPLAAGAKLVENTGKLNQTIQDVKKDAGEAIAATRMMLTSAGFKGSNTRQVEKYETAPQYQQTQPIEYFQPTQFSGGSYDPNIGGGYATWDSSTFSDWGTYQEEQTPSWITSEWGTWD